MSISKFISQSEADTKAIAAAFASKLRGNEKICLTGPFGAGKTTFVRGFVTAFGISSRDVQSPTFTLVREYGKGKRVFHVDLYRLENEHEIFEAGIDELLGTEEMVLIEWAERLGNLAPERCITIRFSHSGDFERAIEIDSPFSLR